MHHCAIIQLWGIMDLKKLEREAELFAILAQPTRLRILYFLKESEQCVCKITPAMPGDPSVTSRHLTKLKEMGILESRREGVSVYYRIADPKIFSLLEIADKIGLSISRRIVDTELAVLN